MFSGSANLQHSLKFSLACRIVQEAPVFNRRIPWGITCLTVYLSLPVFVVSSLPLWFVGKSWSCSFDCFIGLISLITRLGASPCENGQKDHLIVTAVILFPTWIFCCYFNSLKIVTNPFKILQRSTVKEYTPHTELLCEYYLLSSSCLGEPVQTALFKGD